MKTALVCITFLAFSMTGCQCGQPRTPAPGVQKEKAAYDEDGLILERAKQAFYKIPDHKKVSTEAKEYMTPDLYDALSVAWDVPMWADGEIGGEEFLYYFAGGNGDSSVEEVKHAEILASPAMKTDRRKVEIRYGENATIILTMAYESGKWMLDDFGEGGAKEMCRQYILSEVNGYLSGETVGYMKDSQHDEWYSDEYIKKVENSFNDFISSHKSYLNHLK